MIRKHLGIILFLFCIVGFIVTRFYKLPQTLYFWGDIGRDHEMLMEMMQNKKPMLLGPSNSELPFNQPAWYFYLNLPVFILSGYSPYSTAITGTMLMIGAFLYSAWITTERGRDLKKLSTLSLFLLLIIAQPVFLAQQRSTWNPAFALPFIIVATTLLWEILLQKKVTTTMLAVFASALLFSVAMTYASIPLTISYVLLGLWELPKKQKILFLVLLTTFTGIVFLPHLLFEIRYKFLLTNQLLHTARTLSDISFWNKISTGFFSVFGFLEPSVQLGRKLAIFSLLIIAGITHSPKKEKTPLTKLLLTVVICIIVSSALVSQFHSHYGIGLSIVLLFIISKLPKWWGRGITFLLVTSWFTLLQTPYSQKPHRTIAQLDTCAQRICKEQKAPMYVAAQAWHDFHSGYDYSYFMNKNGCITRDIGTHSGFSNKLAVVVDKSAFNPETTSFYELSLFGEKKLEKTYTCKEDLVVHIFSK